MKWYLFYTEGGTMKYKTFDTQEELELDAGKFLFKNKHHRSDYMIDFIIHGNADFISDDFSYQPA
jgi:hypothetical protein